MCSEVWIISAVFLSLCYGEELPLVKLSQGSVIGLKVRSEVASVDYISFRGIPYAAPPIGDLRFKGPKPVSNWSGTLKAQKDGNACLQSVDPPVPPFLMPTSEDCLFLNVYTPYLQVPEGQSLLPVMVYIHGGKFIKRSSDSRMYGPDFFMREKVVLVTINYRLGVYGFLNLELPGVQGNAGLKDQIMALKWVQREIQKFGGNPKAVTIFGNSAGGMSVHFLYLSPLTQGLFHRAIAQSGTAHKMKTISQSNIDIAFKLVSGLNCHATNVKAVMACLRTADSKNIIRTQENISISNHYFYPTIDKNLGEDAVLPTGLRELNSKKYDKVRFMLGVNKDEGIYFIGANNYTEEMKNLENFLPLSIQQSTQQIKNKAIMKLKKFYFNNKPFSNASLRGAVNLYTDATYQYSTIQTIRSLRSRATVYLYQFKFDGIYKFIPPIPLLKKFNITGPAHTDELPYLFYSEHLKQNISTATEDSLTILRMVHMWANFARSGHPTPKKSSDKILNGVVWKPVSKSTTRHLQIGKELEMVNSNLESERIAFWDRLYTKSQSQALQ